MLFLLEKPREWVQENHLMQLMRSEGNDDFYFQTCGFKKGRNNKPFIEYVLQLIE